MDAAEQCAAEQCASEQCASEQCASEQWAADLAAWRIDEQILADAPENPYAFDPALFGVPVEAETAAHRAALDALAAGGTVLDVGCGTGAASLPLAPPAARVIGVDTAEHMLAAMSSIASGRGVETTALVGSWPQIADEVEIADVVVCQHVAYNVAELVPFVRALTAHARRRVVLALHVVHPWVPLGPLWQQVHHQPRPTGPSADLAVAVLTEAGLSPERVDETRATRRDVSRERLVAATRRRLCLSPDRDDEVDALLGDDPQLSPAATTTLWWPGQAAQ